MTALWNDGWLLARWAIVVAACAVAAATDLNSRRIPNALTIPMLVGGVISAAMTAGFMGVADSLLAALLLAIPYLVLFLLAGGGAGDVKLMAAVGSWLGLMSGLVALLCVSICALFFAIGYAILARRYKDVAANVSGAAGRLVVALLSQSSLDGQLQLPQNSENRLQMPYGIAVFLGTALAGTGVLLWRG